ncbi:hypothetical protein AA313_de0201552 [Arthrobotrys entomopaga]|nr:hypothetical protein AA313_de0201552 [Arthrobotrys entomopaga]
MQKDRKTKKSAASGSAPAPASASGSAVATSVSASASGPRSSKSRTNLRTVAPTHLADDSDPYANPKEHRLFTPKKTYNFGRLQPSGTSSHPESVKRRKIVGKKVGIGAAKFTLRETARSRRRHRKVALRSTAEYKRMSIAEQERAMQEIDRKIQLEIAASDREAERDWALHQAREAAAARGDAQTEEGQSPVELSPVVSSAQQLLLRDDAEAVTKKHNRKSSQATHKRPKNQKSSTSLPTIEDTDPGSYRDNHSIYQEVAPGRSRRPTSKKMSSTQKIEADEIIQLKERYKNAKFNSKQILAVKNAFAENVVKRYNYLRSEAESQPGYHALTSKNKKIKLQEIEDRVEAELADTLAVYYSKAEKPLPPGQAAKDAALLTPRDGGMSPTIHGRASFANMEPKLTGAVKQPSSKRRMVETDLPEKTRLHNRSKSSPKKRRLAPLDFEAMDKVSKFNPGETTPSGSETVGDLNPLRRLTRSLTSATSPAPVQSNNTQGLSTAASKRSEPGHGTPLAKTKETVTTARKRKQPHSDSAVEVAEAPTSPPKRFTRSQNLQAPPAPSVVQTTPSSAGSSVDPQRVTRQLPRKAILAQSNGEQPSETNIQGNRGENEEHPDKTGVWEKVLNGDIFKDMLPWVWRGPRPRD